MSLAQIMPDGMPCQLIELSNNNGMKVSVMDWGATLLSCKVLLKDGSLRETILGCRNFTDYIQQDEYIGAIIGRYANKITNASINKGSQQYLLSANCEQHHFNGGSEGLDKRRWEIAEKAANSVALSLCSDDNDQGYPGTLRVTVEYTLNDDNHLQIDFIAIVDKECPVNLISQIFFNLDSGGDARRQRIWVDADSYLPVDQQGVPAQALRSVVEGKMDLRRGVPMLADFMNARERQISGGYDHSYLLNFRADNRKFAAAQLWSADNQLMMNLYTNKPALYIYSGNNIASVPGRKGGNQRNFAGIVLAPTFLPDSPNHPEWPQADCWLKPNQVYRYYSAYQFISL